MTQEVKIQLLKRLKSFAWRLGAYVVVAGLSALVDMLGILEVEPAIITVVALIAGEFTKFVNTFENK